MTKPKPFSDQLRDAVRSASRSNRQLALSADIAPANLSKFLSKTSGLSLDALDRLIEALGGRLVIEGAPVADSSTRKDGKRGKSQQRQKRKP